MGCIPSGGRRRVPCRGRRWWGGEGDDGGQQTDWLHSPAPAFSLIALQVKVA